MKKKEVQDIIRKWTDEYARKGVSNDLSKKYVDYAESLIKKDLPPIIDLQHLSLLIGIDHQLTVSIIHSPKSFYREFKIPKRSGGVRIITAPYPSLKFIQRWIYNNILIHQKPQFCAHGFVEGKSILTNAMKHKNCKALLKMDIKDFFGSIPQNFIINYFHKELGYNLNISYFLSCICCLNGTLPQGAPTSPTLSNLISLSLDRRLYRLAKKFNLSYTRYADDIAFSGEEISSGFIDYVKEIVRDCNLEINEDKTRLYCSGGSKIIAGVSLANGIPRVPRDYRRVLRKELHYVLKYGLDAHMRHNKITKANYIDSLRGKVAYWLSIEPWNEYARECSLKLKTITEE